jgi:hypothetical protein
MGEIMKIILTDMTYTFEAPTTFLVKKIKINAQEEIQVYPIMNEFNLISVFTNKESDIYLEPITTQNITMNVIGYYGREVNVSSIEIELLTL